jgi:ATP-binding cassette subfamily B protein
MTLSNLLASAAAAAVYLFLVWTVVQRQHTVGDLVFYGGAVSLLYVYALDLGLTMSALPMVTNFLPSLFRVLDAAPDLPLPKMPKRPPHPIAKGIAFESVTFAYPGQPAPVLRDLSCHIRPGECVALVGRNGAGKTTIVKLLLRLYDPTVGRITLDGLDLREYDLEDLRRQMGVIFQDFMRYELTAGENIAMGQLESLSDRPRLFEAAVRAGADEFIQRLPAGLDTTLGREFGGRDLSGGEWQKLALARAFVRDCQILVLDEPTAALDVPTEYAMYTRFRELTCDRTTLLISHRFSTVRMADRILYLADGRIQEAGSHTELLAQNGAYAQLYRMQAAHYHEQNTAEAD